MKRCVENEKKSSSAGKNKYWIEQNRLIFIQGKEKQMWIRSQNGLSLIAAEKYSIVIENTDKTVKMFAVNGDGKIILGEYPTMYSARNELNRIQEMMCNGVLQVE